MSAVCRACGGMGLIGGRDVWGFGCPCTKCDGTGVAPVARLRTSAAIKPRSPKELAPGLSDVRDTE